MIKGLSHIDLAAGATASQLQATVAFYVDLLDFQVVPQPDAATDTTKAGVDVWLQNFGAGLALHLSTKVTSMGSIVLAVIAKLTDAKIPFDTASIQEDKQSRVIEIHLDDPAGNAIVLSARPSPFSSSILPENIQATLSTTPATDGLATANVPLRKRIAVLTSGGDSAGMNAALRAIVRMGIYRNCEVYAVHEGYQGMVDGGDHNIHLLQWQEVAGIIAEGGTIIGTARCKEMRTREGRMKAVYNLVSRGIDAIIVTGGDGSLTGANTLRNEWASLLADLVQSGKISPEQAARHPVMAVVGLVGSIDNDVHGTAITIGADTALHRVVEAVNSLTSTAASHQRCFVVEVMGRNCGWLALNAALACGADWLLIPEAPSTAESWENEMCQALIKHKERAKRRLMVMVSEGAIDRSGNPIKSEYVRSVIEAQVKIETRVTILGHVQRGGKPSSFDRITPTLQGVDAVDAVLQMTGDMPALMIGINHNKITRLPLMECVEKTLIVSKAMADKDFEKAVCLRGGEFAESVSTFKKIANAAPVGARDPANAFRIAVVHIGAPAGGMNTATRTVVRQGLSHGYVVLGVHNSFEGLAGGDVEELTWNTVDNWSMKGGSELGTNRSKPSDDYGMVAFNLQKFDIHGLVIIGGFEGLMAARELMDNRSKYPQFCIPIIHLPATISNNVPGTEQSLGSDTALNIIIEAVDELKQSASSSKRRVFVVETMGGQCGFLATYASLGGGATRCYIPEDGIAFEDLAEDLEQLKRKFRNHKGVGRVIVRCENSSPTYTIDFIAALLNEEGKKCGLFDARTCNLGHLQQGGIPSPLDRVRGVRLASQCIMFMEEQIMASIARRADDVKTGKITSHSNLPVHTDSADSVCIVGYREGRLALTRLTDLLPETDFKLRRPKEQWWRSVGPLLRILTGYD